MQKSLKQIISKTGKYNALKLFFSFEYLKSCCYDIFHKSPVKKGSYEKYVSLGCDCFPRTFFTNNGIKPKKAAGEKSMPLDLMYYSNLNKIIQHILTDFKHFLSDVSFYNEDNIFKSSDGMLKFNHEEDIGNDFEKLKIRYITRINNFLEILNPNIKVLFICHMQPGFNVNTLYKILKYKKKKNFSLMVIDTSSHPPKNNLRKEIIYIKKPFPAADFIWYKDMQTPAGKAYQKELLCKIKENI